MHLNLSLRSKLILIISGLLSLVVIGICYYLINIQRDSYIKKELDFQNTISSLIMDDLSAQYYNYLNQQIFAVLNEREGLREKTRIIDSYNQFIGNYPNADINEFMQRQSKLLNTIKLHFFAFDHKNGRLFYDTNDEDLLNSHSVSQSNRTILNTIKSDVSSSGYFLAVKYHDDFYIAYFFKAENSNKTFALVKNIEDLTQRYSSGNEELLNSLKESLQFLHNSWQGDILILENKHVIFSSAANTDSSFNLPTELLLKSQSDDIDTQFIEGLNAFVKVNYFRPLNWYLVSVRDADLVLTPIKDMTKFVIILSLITIIIAIILSIILTRSVTLSLSRLSKKAYMLATSDLADPKATQNILADLKVNTDDEIGNLERAMIHMGQSITDNVNTLIQVNSKQSRIEGELDAARDIQKGLLPAKESLPTSSSVSFDACLYSAKEVAGDFYDIFRIDDKNIAFVIGDVSDKGVPAALFMATTITMIRQALSMGNSPAKALSSVNNRLAERNPNMMFVTMLALIFNEKTNVCTLCNAGHCLPIVISEDKIIELDDISGPAAGVLEDIEYGEYTYTLKPNETILLYTDGISEAQNEKGEFLGVDKVIELLKNTNAARLDCHEILSTVNKEVLKFRGKALQSDDITALCFKRI